MKILITGATGFVGRSLVPYLRQQGHTVHRAVRVATEPTDVTVADVREGITHDSLSQVDSVIHLAALAHRRSGSDLDYTRTNRDAAVLLAEQSAAAGVSHFMFVSTSKVYGEFSTQPFTKNSPLAPPDAYSDSKAQAEIAIAALNSGMTTSAIRPPVVYGPGAAGNIGLLVKALSKGIPIPVAKQPNSRSIIFIENLSSALDHVLRRTGSNHLVFQPADAGTISFQAMASVVGEAIGRRPRFVTLPEQALALGQAPLRLFGRAPLDPIFRDFELAADDDLLELGWLPTHGSAAALAQTARSS